MIYTDLMKSAEGTVNIMSFSVEFGLRAFGMWPGTSYAYLRRICYILLTALVQTLQYQYLIAHFDEDISSVMDVLSVVLSYSMVFFKLIFFAVKARQIDEIIVHMGDDWKERDVSDEYAMTRMLQISRRFTNLIIILNMMAVVSYATGTILMQMKNNQTDARELLVKMELPYKIESTSVYMMTFFTQCAHQTTVVGMMAVMDSLLLTLVLHVCGQIDIVRQRLSEISWKDIDESTTKDIVKQLIVRHQRIISFSENIEAAYSNVALVQFVSNTMVICCLGFLIVISPDLPNGSTMLIKSILFYINMSVETLIYCFAGEYLSTKSESIGDAAYESLWYHLKPNRNRDLLLMIVRSQKHLKLTVGKFVELSLQQFGNVVKASASYVSVLHAMY